MELDKTISVYPFKQFGFCSLIPERVWQVERKWETEIGREKEGNKANWINKYESLEQARTTSLEEKEMEQNSSLWRLVTECFAQQPQRGAWEARSGSHVQQIQVLLSTAPVCTSATEMSVKLMHLSL